MQSVYDLDREVGRGAFAAVYLATRKRDGFKVAIKRVLRKSKHVGVDWTALREIKLMQEMVHPNIVRLLDVYPMEDSMNMVMELCPFDLKKVIDNKKILLSESIIKSYMKMILKGTQALHEYWILHRDLKPDNILVGSDRQLKLADFGLARIFGDEDEEQSYQVVTLPYRAPELLYGAREYSVGIDMWSNGCIMAELMKKLIFLPGMDDMDQLAKIFYTFGTPTETEWPKMKSLNKYHKFAAHAPADLKRELPGFSPLAYEFLTAMMTINPNTRITAAAALKHEWFETLENPVLPDDDLPYREIVGEA